MVFVLICVFATMTLCFYPSFIKVAAIVGGNTSLIGSGTAEDPYKIATANDLITFSAIINSGVEKGYAVLTSDIIFNDEVIKNDGQLSDDLQSFTPIGNKDNVFKRVFDGQNFTISGLYFSDETASCVGGEKVVTVINELKDGISVGVNYYSTDYELSFGEKPKHVGEYIARVTLFDNAFDFNFEITSATVDCVDFSVIEKSATIDENTVEFKDKITLVSAKEDLKTVLNDYRDNYKSSALARYETLYEQVNLSLKTLSNAEKVLESISALPNEIDIEDKNDVEQAKIAY